MEKLIELLNEYEQLNMCRKFDSFEMHTFENSSGVDRLLEDTVISARYGFIKWLVENDKIDYRWMPKFEERSRGTIGIDVEGENRVLMCLAISKHPIEDLLLYLK